MLLVFSKDANAPHGFSLTVFFIIIPIIGVIAVASWLAIAAAYENIRFAQATDQILALIAIAHDYASKDQNFGATLNEDLLNRLVQTGKVPPPKDGPQGGFINAWQGAVTATAIPGFLMRLETHVPTRDCRRLALFFGKDAKDLALTQMEAREEGGAWRQFYAAPDSIDISPTIIDAACGQASWSTLALIFRLH